jgi:predicted dienelactone hydrolase
MRWTLWTLLCSAACASGAATTGTTTGAADVGTSDAASWAPDAAVHAEAGAATDGAAESPYGVGVLAELAIPGPAGRSLPATIWYPIAKSATGTAFKYLDLIASPTGAIEDAPPAAGPFPLVVFSHGNQGVRQQSVFLTEALARAGYVVVAPDHVGNTFFDFDQKNVLAMAILRPLDVKATISRMLAPTASDPPWLQGLVDPAHIGVTGHSFGGFTTLAAAGVEVAMPPALLPLCPPAPLPGDVTCAALKLAGPMPWQLGDPRASVFVPLAECGSAYGFGLVTASMAAVKAPVVLQAATGDTVCPVDSQSQVAYQKLGGPRALITLQGGDHYSYSDLCKLPAAFSGQLPVNCLNQNPDLATAHAAIVKYTLATFDRYLRGQSAAAQVFTNGVDGVVTVSATGIAP